MKLKPLYFLISLSVLIPSIYSLVSYGLNLSIEFTGGTILTLQHPTQEPQQIEEAFSQFSPKVESSSLDQITLRTETISQQQLDEQIVLLKENNPDINLSTFETVGPSLGKETIRKTIIGIALAAMVLLVYISYTFKDLKFGISAILAMLHDTIILIGSFSLLGHFSGVQTDLLFVTAVLTILSFSVHDTIVVFDRIRELTRKHSGVDSVTIINQSVTDTIIRSLNNSLTIIFMLLALYLLGAGSIKNFSLALLIGTVTGTYSSTFTAAPLLVVFGNLFSKKEN